MPEAPPAFPVPDDLSEQLIEPGAINLMTAGAGIVHSERTPPEERATGTRLFGMQTWLALPDGREEIDPAFEAQTGLPVVEDTCAKATVIMGSLWGQRAPTTTHATSGALDRVSALRTTARIVATVALREGIRESFTATPDWIHLNVSSAPFSCRHCSLALG